MRAAGRPLSPRDLQQCLGCHATAIRATPEGADVARSIMNVGCERCHGPGRAHIFQAAQALAAAARAKTPVAGGKHDTYGMEDLHNAPPQRITTICGGCHRAETPEKPLSPAEEPRIARLQGVALSRSACYQKSGVLSCLTCHDAHGNANPSLARNDAICLRCHSAQNTPGRAVSPQAETGEVAAAHGPHQEIAPAAQTVQGKLCSVNPRAGCTGCHMPKTAGIMPYSLFTNHWIKVWPSSASPPTAAPGNPIPAPSS